MGLRKRLAEWLDPERQVVRQQAHDLLVKCNRAQGKVQALTATVESQERLLEAAVRTEDALRLQVKRQGKALRCVLHDLEAAVDAGQPLALDREACVGLLERVLRAMREGGSDE